jgi:lipoprotein-anchoring transpeptidase ErfK/SrfK
MPIIVRFDRPVTDRTAFERSVSVTVNGHPASGAWYWETRDPKSSGYAMEAHYRESAYWPAHSHIDAELPIQGLGAGPGHVFDNDLSLSMDIGAEHISTVYQSGSPHMTVRSDGAVKRTLPVSLGSADFATYSGVKIVEEFDRVQNMEGTPVPWSVRVTNSGEFVHAASWNGRIGSANTSHGCTNLTTADAEWFFTFSRLGDVIVYPDASGARMNVWDGIGDWNVPWTVWLRGGTA